MTNAKHAKLISSKLENLKFGEGVILDPVRTAVDQHACGGGGSMNCGCINGGGSCVNQGACSGGCGSSNKIKVYQ